LRQQSVQGNRGGSLREATLARQIKLGVVPQGTKLAPKPAAIKDWDSLSANEKKLFARQMEVFAAFSEYADAEIGRLINAIEELGELDNTLIFYIAGDNGTSAEGGENGMFNEYTYLNGVVETVADQLEYFVSAIKSTRLISPAGGASV
jgi:arylsulfatase